MFSKQYLSPESLCRSPITSTSRFNTVASLSHRSVFDHISLLLNMYSGDSARRQCELRNGRIVKLGRQFVTVYRSTWNKDHFFRDVAAMAINFS